MSLERKTKEPKKVVTSSTQENLKRPLDRGKVTALDDSAVSMPPYTTPDRQYECFEEGVRLFHARKFREARKLFQEAVAGPKREIGHKAQLHVQMCERRLDETTLVLNTADDHYNYAITLINARNLAPAQKHLQAALELEPEADHAYYAMALCRGLSGDLNGAYENLKRAIDLQPCNRVTARQDADFAGICNQPPLNRLLFPDKASSL